MWIPVVTSEMQTISTQRPFTRVPSVATHLANYEPLRIFGKDDATHSKRVSCKSLSMGWIPCLSARGRQCAWYSSRPGCFVISDNPQGFLSRPLDKVEVISSLKTNIFTSWVPTLIANMSRVKLERGTLHPTHSCLLIAPIVIKALYAWLDYVSYALLVSLRSVWQPKVVHKRKNPTIHWACAYKNV